MIGLKNIRGTIFITVVLMSMLMIFIAVTISNIILQDKYMINHLKHSIQAQYLAEAGISDAIATLLGLGFLAKDNPANFPQASLGEGTYDVTVIQDGGRVLLSSEGVVEGVSRRVDVEVRSLYAEALMKALATAGDIEIKSVQGSITVKGDIHANGELELEEQGPPTTIHIQAYDTSTGKATSSDEYEIEGNVIIDDALNSGGGRPVITFPSFDFGYLKAEAQAGGVYYGSSQTFNNATLDGGSAGITYVEGSVIFRGDCTIIGGFAATGGIDLDNQNSITQVHDANNRFPIFISDDELKLYGIFDSQEGNVVFATNGVKIRTTGGQSLVLGSVLSSGWCDIVANNDVILTYSRVEGDLFPQGIEIVSWNR